jgi:hypothetical protein
LTTLISRLLKLTFLTKPLSTMLKLAFLTTPPLNPPTLLQLVSELFSSCFFNIPHFLSITNNLFPEDTPEKRTIKKLYCIGEKCSVLLCPPLRIAPPTGEVAKLNDDVTQITSYTGCPKSPDSVLRGHISRTPGPTEMAYTPKDASHP